MTLRAKLTGGFAAIGVIAFAVAGFAYVKLRTLTAALYEVGVVRLPSLQGLGMMREAMATLDRSHEWYLVPGPAEGQIPLADGRRADAWTRFDRGYRVYQPLPQSVDEAAEWNAFVPAAARWRAIHDSATTALIAARRAGDAAGIAAARARFETAVAGTHDRAAQLLDRLTTINLAIAEAAKQRSVASQGDLVATRRAMLIAALLGIGAAALVGLVVGRQLSRPLVEMADALEGIGRGDLAVQLPVRSGDEIGRMSASWNRMVETLRSNEARLTALTDNIPNGMVYQSMGDADGNVRFLYVSSAVETLHGYTAAEVMERPSLIYDQVVAEDRQRLAGAEAEALAKLTVFNVTVRMRRRDGATRWMNISSAPRRMPDGQVVWDGIEMDVTSQHQAAELVRVSEEKFSKAFRSSPVAIGITQLATGRFVEVNDAMESFLGYRRDELIGKTTLELDIWPTPDYRDRLVAAIRRERVIRIDELGFRTKQGTIVYSRYAAELMDIGGEQCLLSVLTNISDLKRAEADLRRVNRALRALSHSNHALVHATDEAGLLREICRIIVEDGGYLLAWVGFAEHDEAKSVRMAAHAGLGESYIERMAISWGDTERGRGPTGTAIRTGRPSVARDVNTDPTVAAWLAQASEVGIRSALSLPLRVDGKVQGALSIYSKDPDAFDHDETELLTELADDLSFGLGAVRGRRALERVLEERRRAEDVLRVSEERFRSAMHHSPIGMGIISPDGRWLEANPALTRILGYERQELIATDLQSLSHPDDRAAALALLQRLRDRVIDNGQLEKRYLHRDGRVVWTQVNVSLVQHADDGPSNVVVQIQDITEREHVQAALMESEARFRQLADTIDEAFWISDVGKVRFVYVSPAYEQIWGCTSEELARSPRLWIDRVHPDDRARVWLAASTRQVDGRYEEEYRIVRPDGSERWVRDRAFPVAGADGKIERVVGVAQDITERRQLEQQLLQAQKMEAIGTLAGGIAHDFNNILTAILGHTELLNLNPDLGSQDRESVAAVLAATARARDLVRQILTFSRKQEEQRAVISLQPVVAEAVSLLRASLPATIEIERRLDPDARAVLADSTQIHQTVMNLGTNAAHAMQGTGGRLTIALESCLVDQVIARSSPFLREGPYVRLTVTDSGSGMTQGTLERIFEPFFTTKPAGEGTGLGLAVVHGIMRSHEGAITVSSELGRGTTFHLYFPAAGDSSELTVEASGPIPTGNQQEVLFVDDEPAIARTAQALLRRLGYRPTVMHDAERALALVRAAPDRFAVVITDLTMPRLTGLALAAEIRRHRPDLPIVLATGFNTTSDTIMAQQIGIQAVLTKPYTISTLAATLKGLVG